MFNETLKSFIKMLKITWEVRPVFGQITWSKTATSKNVRFIFIQVFFYIRNEPIIKRQSFFIYINFRKVAV